MRETSHNTEPGQRGEEIESGRPLKLGVMGMSEGNGHPYSWSAIFNGFDPVGMSSCPFPVIPEYLSERTFPEDALSEGNVTHIWTQELATSRHIARASLIENVVEDPKDMISQIDALLLARDDAENHLAFAAPFLDAGIPIYIDKPLALSTRSANELLDRQQYEGQIFSCSAMKFAKEFQPTESQITAVGRVLSVDSIVMKSWAKYAIHIVDPVLNMLPQLGKVVSSTVDRDAPTNRVSVAVLWDSGITSTFASEFSFKGPVRITLVGEDGSMELSFSDSFSAFKRALKSFVDIVAGRTPAPSREELVAPISIIELGLNRNSLT